MLALGNILLRFRYWVVLLLLCTGALATTHGFLGLLGSETDVLWRWSTRYLGMFLLIGLLVMGLSAWRRISPLPIGLWFGLGTALLTGNLLAVLVLGALALSAFTLGRLILASPRVARVDCLLVGMALLGTVIGLMAFFPIAYPGTCGVLFTIPLLLGWRHTQALLTDIKTWMSTPAPTRGVNWFIQVGVASAAMLHFLVSLMPEVGHDALAMHLFIPAQVIERHAWGFDASLYVWAVWPLLVDWIYTGAYMFAGETGARLANFGGILLSALLVHRLAIWAGAKETGASIAALLLLLTPLAFLATSSLFIETIWTAFLVGGAFAIFRMFAREEDARHDILVAGILLGAAVASKAVSLTALPVLAVVMIAAHRSWLSASMARHAAIALLAFLALGLVPYVTAWVQTGNPVFPFFNDFFQSPYYPSTNFSPPPNIERGLYWDTPYRMMFESDKYLEATPGAPGFQWLILVLPAIVVVAFDGNRRALLLGGVGIAIIWLTFGQTAYLRYILPSFVILSAVVGVALGLIQYLGRKSWRLGLFAVIGVLMLNLLHLHSSTWYGSIDLRVIANESRREAYLERYLPLRPAVQVINELNRNGAPVAFFSAPMVAGLDADALHFSWYNQSFMSAVLATEDLTALDAVLQDHGVEFIVLDDNLGFVTIADRVRQLSDEVARVGHFSVRRILQSQGFTTELLDTPEIIPESDWVFSGDARYLPGKGALVTVSSPAFTLVPVRGGTRYLQEATVLCHEGPTQGRLQVNWIDSDGRLLDVDIAVFDCPDEPQTRQMEVRAPRKAVQAVIYASGHTDDPIIFQRISFRR